MLNSVQSGYADLVKRLEASDEPDRELDALIWCFFHPEWAAAPSLGDGAVSHIKRKHASRESPRFTHYPDGLSASIRLMEDVFPTDWQWAHTRQNDVQLHPPRNPSWFETELGHVPGNLCRSFLVAILLAKAKGEELGRLDFQTSENADAGAVVSEGNKKLKPHAYVPSAMHMGDCSICGQLAAAEIHDSCDTTDTHLTNEEIAREIACTYRLEVVDFENLEAAIAAAIDKAVAEAQVGCEEAAAKAPDAELLPEFEPTEVNKRLWEVAVNTGVLNAVQAIRNMRAG